MPDDNAPSSTEPIRVEVADPNVALAAAESATGQDSAGAAAGADTSSLKSESSSAAGEPAELTFEQLVEQRFVKLEAALMGLPSAIHQALSEGSHSTHESFCARVLQHLFKAL